MSEPIYDAESVPKLYGNPRMLGFFTHVQAVSSRLSFFERLGTRPTHPIIGGPRPVQGIGWTWGPLVLRIGGSMTRGGLQHWP